MHVLTYANSLYIMKFLIAIFFPKSEGTEDIVTLGTIPLATIEKFNKMVYSYLLLIYYYVLFMAAWLISMQY